MATSDMEKVLTVFQGIGGMDPDLGASIRIDTLKDPT